MVDRLQDKFDLPDAVQRWRIERLIRREEQTREASWFFRGVPEDRLRQFHDDLTELVHAIRATGSCPILLTHATAVARPLDTSEINALRGLRTIRPRATEDALIDFEEAARRATIHVGEESGTAVIDVAGRMSGHRPWFAPDFVHFNDEGAGEIAQLIAGRIATELSQAGNSQPSR